MYIGFSFCIVITENNIFINNFNIFSKLINYFKIKNGEKIKTKIGR